MAERKYQMRKRAEGQDATRERIVEATAALHYEHGVTATSYIQIAERAGVGAATVYRHFPTLGSLVEACGAHVNESMQPPLPENAQTVFAGLGMRGQRLERLVAELDAFYDRGAVWLGIAARDRGRVPELDAFLRQVEAGVEALVREAIGAGSSEAVVRLTTALADVSVWLSLKRLDAPPAEFRRTMAGLLDCANALAAHAHESPARP
ncbi:MAG: TetR/AcrR family transcriptional regulator [Aestuariivirga sp.]|nr:TetR/AcrR family transcriptional regulator [Aestuariivirga sp.]